MTNRSEATLAPFAVVTQDTHDGERTVGDGRGEPSAAAVAASVGSWTGPLSCWGEDPPRARRTDVDADASEEAFFRLHAGGRGAALREKACASPHWAYYLARVVDARPSDETRRGACAHPYYATLYARDVDRTGRDDTRASACKHRWAAVNYARDVDHEATPPVRKVASPADLDEALRVAEVLYGKNGAAPKPGAAGARLPSPTGRRVKVRPLDADEAEEIEGACRRGARVLGVAAKGAPEAVVAAIDAKIREARARARPASAVDELATNLGALFGRELVRAARWGWCHLDLDGFSSYAVAAPGGAFATYAIVRVKELILHPEVGGSLLLLFNLVVAGDLPRSAKGSYLPIK